MMLLLRLSIQRIVSKRYFSSNSSSRPHIPSPTWSLASLQLDQNHEPISMSTFRQLAKRALIDVDRLENKKQLRQDLGNMFHMMEQVVEAAKNNDGDGEKHLPADPVELYDVPRGVTEAPVRDGQRNIETEKDSMEDAVYENLLQPKMTPEGAHQYFDIMTARSVKQP